MSVVNMLQREVELVHLWLELIEDMEWLAQQRYFDLGGASSAADESRVPTMAHEFFNRSRPRPRTRVETQNQANPPMFSLLISLSLPISLPSPLSAVG